MYPAGPTPASPAINQHPNPYQMKARSERMAERATGVFAAVLRQQIADTREAMDAYAETHTEEEIGESRQYEVLTEAHYGAMMLLKRVTSGRKGSLQTPGHEPRNHQSGPQNTEESAEGTRQVPGSERPTHQRGPLSRTRDKPFRLVLHGEEGESRSIEIYSQELHVTTRELQRLAEGDLTPLAQSPGQWPGCSVIRTATLPNKKNP